MLASFYIRQVVYICNHMQRMIDEADHTSMGSTRNLGESEKGPKFCIKATPESILIRKLQ